MGAFGASMGIRSGHGRRGVGARFRTLRRATVRFFAIYGARGGRIPPGPAPARAETANARPERIQTGAPILFHAGRYRGPARRPGTWG